MKKSLILLLLTTMLAGVLNAQDVTKWTFSDMELDLKFVPTPLLTSNTNLNLPGTKIEQRKWLLVTLMYTTPEIYLKKEDNRILSYDNLKVSMKVIAKNGKKENWSELFSGDIQYEFISTDGNKHIALGFIPPQYIKRFLNKVGEKKGDVKDNFIALVEIKDSRDMVVAAAVLQDGKSEAMYSAPTGNKIEFNKYKGGKLKSNPIIQKIRSNIEKFEQNIRRKNDHRDLILDRGQTPWEYLEMDRLEVLKRETRR